MVALRQEVEVEEGAITLEEYRRTNGPEAERARRAYRQTEPEAIARAIEREESRPQREEAKREQRKARKARVAASERAEAEAPTEAPASAAADAGPSAPAETPQSATEPQGAPDRARSCAWCGKPLKPGADHRERYCSPAHKLAMKRERDRVKRGLATAHHAPVPAAVALLGEPPQPADGIAPLVLELLEAGVVEVELYSPSGWRLVAHAHARA
jgi:hypothetical protein